MLGTNPPGMLNLVTYRRDLWHSRKDAERALRKSPIFAAWDSRAFERMVEYGLRNLPTALYPEPPPTKLDSQETHVTLTTTKHQEVWTLMRQNLNSRDCTGRIHVDRSTHADLDPLVASSPFYRPEPRSTWYRLPELRPSVLFLTGGATEMRLDEIREGIKITGTGVGGSGGLKEGRVKEKTFPDRGHLFPMEIVNETAQECVSWLGDEVRRWKEAEMKWNRERANRPKDDDLRTSELFKSVVRPPMGDPKAKAKGVKL
ncbi:MAG: hypothetical protein LQ338_001240 [Usnochroma carphineum]|nr:MAG: hypothetical protein LQ338_001240 [Usnochroma carphineum]